MIPISDYRIVIVGSGFFGSVIAEQLSSCLKQPILVIEKRDHIGGNCYSKDDKTTGIHYHKYGTHIFHTSNDKVWHYINQFTTFNSYVHQVLTTYQNQVYQMPINLETINSFYGVNLKPFEVQGFLQKEIQKEPIQTPQNFEEKAISMMGRPLYEAFIKGYTLKQWQKNPKDLPSGILTRLPFRTNYQESYFFDRWQGIPTDGYTAIFEKLLSHSQINVIYNTDFFKIRHQLNPNALIVYSGPIDQFFNYQYGKLEWRTLDFEHWVEPVSDYQGTSVMNYAEESVPYTRIHEPKHLHPEKNYTSERTLLIKEFSKLDTTNNPYYPINDQVNQDRVIQYRDAASQLDNVYISGRLGDYKYYDMEHTIAKALETAEMIIKKMT